MAKDITQQLKLTLKKSIERVKVVIKKEVETKKKKV